MVVFLISVFAEAYSPKRIIQKVRHVYFLRVLKLAAIFCNEKLGKALCKWKDKENVLLDRIGKDTEMVFKLLYEKKLTQKDVEVFINKRAVYCLVTILCTLLQILCSTWGKTKISLCISMLIAPITIVERQWATLVTKMFPRYERSKIIQIQRVTKNLLLPDVSISIEHRAKKIEKICSIPNLFFVFMEMCVGVLQFFCGTLLFVFIVHEILILFEINQSWVIGRVAGYVSYIRIVKEITNVGSVILEKALTPVKFRNNSNLLIEFLKNVKAEITSQEISEKIQSREIKQCTCLEEYLQYQIGEDHQPFFFLISHIHCEN